MSNYEFRMSERHIVEIKKGMNNVELRMPKWHVAINENIRLIRLNFLVRMLS